MPKIRVSCEDCGAKFQVSDQAAGKKARCPECKAVVRVPAEDEEDEIEEEEEVEKPRRSSRRSASAGKGKSKKGGSSFPVGIAIGGGIGAVVLVVGVVLFFVFRSPGQTGGTTGAADGPVKPITLDKKLMLGCDSGALIIYDPAAIAHRAEDRADWIFSWAEHEKEIKAGNLIQFATTDQFGVMVVRATSGALTENETKNKKASFKWPLRVIGGKITIRDAAYTERKGHKDDPRLPMPFMDVPNGKYIVTVTAIAPLGPKPAPGTVQTLQPDSHPNFVLQFEPTADLSKVPPPTGFVSLGLKSDQPSFSK